MQFNKCRYNRYSNCSTGNSNNYSERTNDFLYGRFGNIDIFRSNR